MQTQSKITSLATRESKDCVCFCRQVDRTAIEYAIREGACSLDAVCQATGAGSECGSCRITIQGLLGHEFWSNVYLVSSHRYSQNYCAFRLRRTDGSRWQEELPGAYFMFQVLIEGEWVGRPYALTDDGHESGLREIIVKRKSEGYFSNWLYEHFESLPHRRLRVSECLGGSESALSPVQHRVCLVGGVGITPVLALCRTLHARQQKVSIYIDYSSSSEEDFFCRDELKAFAETLDIQVNFRQTGREGRLQQADIDALIRRFPHNNFYICGPESYKSSVMRLLRKSQVTPMRIIDLEAANHPSTTTTKMPVPDGTASHGIRIAGLGLLAAYCLQEWMGLKFQGLEQLQSQMDYKVFSGLVLLSYLLLQWRLPLMRLFRLSIDRNAKRQSHRILGVFAPLVFYLHSTSTGAAYLSLLASCYLVNTLVALLDAGVVAEAFRKAYLVLWTLVHIALSTGLMFLSAYHIYAALAYK